MGAGVSGSPGLWGSLDASDGSGGVDVLKVFSRSVMGVGCVALARRGDGVVSGIPIAAGVMARFHADAGSSLPLHDA
jgi:hypothetical protein